MIILIICLLLLIVFLIFSCYLKVEFSYVEKFVIKVKYGFFTVYSNESKATHVPENDSNVNKAEFELKKLKEIILKVKRILQFFHDRLKKHLKITYLSIEYTFGFDDAAITGMYSGLAYAVIYSLIGYVDNNFTLNGKNIIITPDFDNEIQSLKLTLCAKMRLYRLLLWGIKSIRLWLK